MAEVVKLKVLSYGSFLNKAIAPVLYLSKQATLKFNENGLTLVASDPATSNVVLVLRMDSKNFDFFHCDGDVVAGVNLDELYKMLTFCTEDECITIYEPDGTQKVTIGLGRPHREYRERMFCEMELNEVDHQNLRIAAVDFSYDVSVGIPSTKFREIITFMRKETEVSVTITKAHVRFSGTEDVIIVREKPGHCVIHSNSQNFTSSVALKWNLRNMSPCMNASVESTLVWLFYCPDTPTLLHCYVKSRGTYYFYFFDEPQQH